MDLPCKRYSDHKRKGEEPFEYSEKISKVQESFIILVGVDRMVMDYPKKIP